jgi:hypothetical protein
MKAGASVEPFWKHFELIKGVRELESSVRSLNNSIISRKF